MAGNPHSPLQELFREFFSTFVQGLTINDTDKTTLSNKLYSAGLITREARDELKSTNILRTIESAVETSPENRAKEIIADFLYILNTQPATEGLAEQFSTKFHQKFHSKLPQPSKKAFQAAAPTSETGGDRQVVHSDPSYDWQRPTPLKDTSPTYYCGGCSQELTIFSRRSEPSLSIANTQVHSSFLQTSRSDTRSLSNIWSPNVPESEKVHEVNDQLSADMPEVHGQGVSQQETAQGPAGSVVVPSPSDFQLSEKAELAHKSYVNTKVCGTGAGVKDCCSCVPMELHQQVCGDIRKQNTRLTEENSKLQNEIRKLEEKVAKLKWLMNKKENFMKELEEYLVNK